MQNLVQHKIVRNYFCFALICLQRSADQEEIWRESFAVGHYGFSDRRYLAEILLNYCQCCEKCFLSLFGLKFDQMEIVLILHISSNCGTICFYDLDIDLDLPFAGPYSMCICSVLVRPVMATLLSHWEASRDKSAANSPRQLEVTSRVIQCLSKVRAKWHQLWAKRPWASCSKWSSCCCRCERTSPLL